MISSPNILLTTKYHYNCSEIKGMQIENLPGAKSAGSHWERTILNGEILGSSLNLQGQVFSNFTYALLKGNILHNG